MSEDALSLLEEVPTLHEEIDGAKTFGQSSLNLEEQLTHHSMTCGSHFSCCQICIVNSELKSTLMTFFGVQSECFMSAI